MEFCTPRTTRYNKVQGLDNSHWFPEGDELDKNGYLKRNVEKQLFKARSVHPKDAFGYPQWHFAIIAIGGN